MASQHCLQICTQPVLLVLQYILLLTLCGNFRTTLAQDEKTLTYSLYEETPSNTFIADIRQGAGLQDEFDADVFTTLRFAISAQDSKYDSFFAIDEVEGVLRTGDRIDRDNICKQQVRCEIRLDITIQPRQYFQIIKIVVTIEDTNDNPPNFNPGHYTTSIAENTRLGASFTIPTAEDPDSPKFGVKRYDLITGAPQFSLKVNNNSDGSVDLHLVLQEAVDRETRELYRVVVAAYDGGPQANSGFLTIDVTISDINDNNPKFELETYNVTVPENVNKDTNIIRVKALDADSGMNGKVVYSFAPKTQQSYGHLFHINNASGEISVKGSLDYEENEVYNLGVNARDLNPESLAALAKVIVRVQDVNDHAPQIKINALTTTGHVEISEGEPAGSFVAHISVADPDSGNNGLFTCSINNPYFTIEKMYQTEYKVTTTQTLDRESTANYDLAFICEDQGAPAMTSTAHISVNILDVNDNPPTFNKNAYSAILAENNPIGSFIIQVNATDPDLGQNGLIEYRPFGRAVNYLTVNPISGNVTARVRFDYEEAETMQFLITATDHGTPSFTATSTLLLKLTDVDDEKPEFTAPTYVFDVYENLPLGTEVGQVTAVDKDSPPFNNFNYALDPDASATEAFVVEPQTGRIFTRQELDREEKSQYKLVVLAISKDAPDMRTNVDVLIHVADKNDNLPLILFPNVRNDTVHIPNKTPVGDKVTEIKVTDLDIGINSQLTFTIVEGNERKLFTINEETGMILVKSNLAALKDELFQIAIEVKDNGNPQHKVDVVLNIVVNKSAEHFMMSSKNLNIVVSVAAVSAFFAIILIIAIVRTCKCQRQERNKGKYLSYTPGADQKVLVMEQGKAQATRNTEIKHNKNDPSGKKEVTFSKHIDLKDEHPSKYPALDKSGDSGSSYPPQYSQTRGSSSGSSAGGGSGQSRTPATHASSGGSAKSAAGSAKSAAGAAGGSSGYPSVHQLALNHPRPGLHQAGGTGLTSPSSQHETSLDHTPEDLQHCLNKEADSDSTNSAALSITDSGRGSNEGDTTETRANMLDPDHAHIAKDGLLLRPPSHNDLHVNKGSFRTRLSGVVQMQSEHAQQSRTSGGSQRPSSDRFHNNPPSERNYLKNTNSERLKGATTFNPQPHTSNPHHRLSNKPSVPTVPGPQHGAYNTHHGRLNHHGNHHHKDNNYLGNSNNSYIEEETESEYSDEDKEYVYYVNVNASHV